MERLDCLKPRWLHPAHMEAGCNSAGARSHTHNPPCLVHTGVSSHPIGGALLTLVMQLHYVVDKYCGPQTSPILLSSYTAVFSGLMPLAQQEAQQLKGAGQAGNNLFFFTRSSLFSWFARQVEGKFDSMQVPFLCLVQCAVFPTFPTCLMRTHRPLQEPRVVGVPHCSC